MRIVLAIIAGLLSVNCWGTVSESTTPSPFKIEANEPFKSPISPLLYGNFIELGYGYQVEPMCSEMFFNRSFEVFPPYKTINKLWYDLYYDEKDLDKGYENSTGIIAVMSTIVGMRLPELRRKEILLQMKVLSSSPQLPSGKSL